MEALPRPTSGDAALARKTTPRTLDRSLKVRTVPRSCARLSKRPPWRKVRSVFNLGEVDTPMKTHKLATTEADIVYDVRGPLPTADGRPPLFMIAQPMDASGFSTLASRFPDRTVITYDPRGLGRSTRKDGR